MTGNNEGFREKIALITGASGGLGLEFARLFARGGYNLVLVARNEELLREVATELEQEHRVEVRVIIKDLARPEAPQEIFEELQTNRISLSALVNNAGFASYGPFAELNLSNELEMIQVNLVALTHLTKLFLPGLLERKEGKILNIASTAAFLPGPLMTVYYATKAYVLSFSEGLANELEDQGITVSAFCPGPVQTGFQKRAALEDSKLISDKKIMDAPTAARIGYEALFRGKTVVVPGLKNKVMVQALRFTPRKIVTGIVRKMQEQDH